MPVALLGGGIGGGESPLAIVRSPRQGFDAERGEDVNLLADFRHLVGGFATRGQRAGFCVTATMKYHELCFDSGMAMATVSFDRIS